MGFKKLIKNVAKRGYMAPAAIVMPWKKKYWKKSFFNPKNLGKDLKHLGRSVGGLMKMNANSAQSYNQGSYYTPKRISELM